MVLILCLFFQDPEDLIELLSDESVVARQQAAEALVALGRKALPALEKAARGENRMVARATREAISRIHRAELRREITPLFTPALLTEFPELPAWITSDNQGDWLRVLERMAGVKVAYVRTDGWRLEQQRTPGPKSARIRDFRLILRTYRDSGFRNALVEGALYRLAELFEIPLTPPEAEWQQTFLRLSNSIPPLWSPPSKNGPTKERMRALAHKDSVSDIYDAWEESRETAVPAIRRLLAMEGGHLHDTLLLAIRWRADEAEDEILDLLDPSCPAFSTACLAVSRLHLTNGIRFLAQACESNAEESRVSAILALASFAPTEHLGLLLKGLRETNGETRAALIEGIAMASRGDHLQTILEYERDPDPTVRRAVVRALGLAGDKSQNPRLRDQLADSDLELQALDALGLLRDDRSADAFRARLERFDPAMRRAARLALARIGVPDWSELLTAAWDDELSWELNRVLEPELFAKVTALRLSKTWYSGGIQDITQGLVRDCVVAIETDDGPRLRISRRSCDWTLADACRQLAESQGRAVHLDQTGIRLVSRKELIERWARECKK